MLSKQKTGYWLKTQYENMKICSVCKKLVTKVADFDYPFCPYCTSQNVIKQLPIYKEGDDIYYTSPVTIDIAKGKVITTTYVNDILDTICVRFNFGNTSHNMTFDAKYIDINLFRTLKEAKAIRKEWKENGQQI